jgi:uncharacterized protein YaeQ
LVGAVEEREALQRKALEEVVERWNEVGEVAAEHLIAAMAEAEAVRFLLMEEEAQGVMRQEVVVEHVMSAPTVSLGVEEEEEFHL